MMFFKKKIKRTIRKINILGDFTLIHDYIPESDITQISCEVNCGSYHEGSVGVPAGTAHFVEHMVFNGSRDFDKKSLLRVREEGADINAFTTHKGTTYYIDFLTGTNDNFLIILTKFISMIFNPKFDKKELEKERNIILNEIKNGTCNPFITHFNNIALGFKNKNYRNPIPGTLDSIEKVTVSDLEKFHSKLYKTNNTIMYISSSMNFKFIEEEIARIFLKYAKTSVMFNNKIIVDTRNMFNDYKSPNENETEHPVSVVSFIHLFPKKIFYNLSFIDDIYCGGLGSILWNKLREENSLCYNYNSNFTILSDYNISYNITIECKKEDLNQVGEIINSTFYNLGETILGKDQLAESSYNRFYSEYSRTKLNPLEENYMNIPFYHKVGLLNKKETINFYKKFKNDRFYLLDDIDFHNLPKPIIVTSLEK